MLLPVVFRANPHVGNLYAAARKIANILLWGSLSVTPADNKAVEKMMPMVDYGLAIRD